MKSNVINNVKLSSKKIVKKCDLNSRAKKAIERVGDKNLS